MPLHDIGQRFAQAEAAFHALHYREALEAYTDCVKLRLAARESDDGPRFGQGDAVVIERLADLSMLFGWFETADSLLSGLELLFERAGNALASIHASAKRIELALAAGQSKGARGAVERLERWTGPLADLTLTGPSLENWERRLVIGGNRSDRDGLLVSLYKALGGYLSANGQFRDTLALYRRGLQHATASRTDLASRFETPFYLAIAAAHIALAEIAAGEEALAKADEGVHETIDPALRLQKLEIEAGIAKLKGDFGHVLRRMDAIEALAREHGFIKAELLAAVNHAHVLILVNHTEAARRKLGSALERAERIGDESSRRRAMALLELTTLRGRSFVEGAPLAQTVTEMQRAHPSVRPRPQQPSGPIGSVEVDGAASFIARFEDRALSVQWVLSAGDLTAAEAMLALMQQDFGATDSPHVHLRLGMLSGMIAYYAGSYAAALALLERVTAGFRQFGLVPDLWQALRIKGWCLARLGDNGENAIATREEADRLLVVMTNSLRPIDRPVFLLNKWSQQEELFAGQLDILVRLKSKADRSFWPSRLIRNIAIARRLDALLAHVDRYKRTLARQTVLEEAVEGEPSSGHGLLRRLFSGSRREATIAFFVLPDRILVVLQRRGRLSFGISPVTRLALRESVRRWHLCLGLDKGTRDLGLSPVELPGHQESLGEIASELSGQILLPEVLSALPSRIARIRFIPDDALHGFPFAALRLGEKYLAERYSITIGYDLLVPAQDGGRSRDRKAVVAAVSRGARGIPPLPNAATEMEVVAGLLRSKALDVALLDSDHADHDAITAALENSRLVHIACHGVFIPDAPDRSGLVLLPARDKLQLLSLRDLLSLDLRGLKQITLSSCWSADNFVLPGRRVVSLPETLMRAGAESVIGSLWPIADEVALPLMTRLYHLLAVKERAEALRQVQLEMIASSLAGCRAVDQASPRLWAGITLFGAGDRLSI